MTKQWKFDHDVASIFVDHARQHIPNYETVIDKSMIYTRTRHIEDSGILAVLYYWFFQLYFRCFKYPAFTLWILKGIVISTLSNNNKTRFISNE